MMTKKATIRDLANAANVSVTTVSQILNGKGQRFSNETKQKVLKLQEELNYVPDFNARNLIMKTSKTIGVLVPNIGNPFFSTFIKGIQRQSRQLQFTPFIFSANHDKQLESYYLKQLVERAADGLIIASASITVDALDGILKRNKIPYLLLDQNSINDGDRVETDDVKGGMLAADHLSQLGHRRFAVVMPDSPTDNLSHRLEGFKTQLRSQKIEPDITLIHSPMTKLGGYQATEQVLASHASAVFAINDEMAIGLYRGLREQKISVPTDLSIIGYDDIDLDEYVTPALTTIAQPIMQMGETATELLVSRIQHPGAEVKTIHLPVELIVRDSTKRLD